MPTSLLERSNQTSAFGAAILELLVVLPLLLLFGIQMYDLANVLYHHGALVRLAGESILLASNEPHLEAGEYTFDRGAGTCTLHRTPNSSGEPCPSFHRHTKYVRMVDQLLEREEPHGLSFVPGTQRIVSRFSFPPVAAGTISLEIHGDYQGIFFPFDRLHLSGESVSSYFALR